MVNAIMICVTACCFSETSQADNNAATRDILPMEPDYGETSQWYTTYRSGEGDIFYITSTETGDYKLNNTTTCHYADTYSDSVRSPLTGEMKGVDRLLSGKMNFYAPYYRQCSMQSFTNDSLKQARLVIPTDDIRKAFTYYLTKINTDRPFILAGYSQGALIALQLMRDMDDDTYRRMAAAYIIGAPITQEQLDECPKIIPAQRADDTGVTICYNSVRDASCTMWQSSAVCINPVNWHTDGLPATLVTVPSPRIPAEEQKEDNLTITLDISSKLLFVSGFTGTDYILPLIGKEGNYHSREIWLYREQLRDNMQLRIEKHNK